MRDEFDPSDGDGWVCGRCRGTGTVQPDRCSPPEPCSCVDEDEEGGIGLDLDDTDEEMALLSDDTLSDQAKHLILADAHRVRDKMELWL